MVARQDRKEVTTIQVEKDLAETLRSLGRMGDTYSTVIRRLLNGKDPIRKGEPHGEGEDEPTRVGDHHKG